MHSQKIGEPQWFSYFDIAEGEILKFLHKIRIFAEYCCDSGTLHFK